MRRPLVEMKRLLRPRLVTFDVTGTLLMTALEEHYAEVGLQHGLPVLDREKLARSFKANYKKLSTEHPIYGLHTGLGWENWWRTIVFNVFKEQNRNACDTALGKVADSLIECYSTNRCWQAYPGAVDLLEYLKSRGVILGVISNFDERLDAVLVDTEIRSYFSFVLSSYILGVEKPHPTIFEEALKRSKIQHGVTISPEEAVHIGDHVEADYFGAKRADWNAILIMREEDESWRKDGVLEKDVFGSLDELQTHFRDVLNEKASDA
ncbi:rhythmically expressed gene 2 protein-like [Orussus abietinus]|uniref:rhythmically expressed gene 2 protein-like n=1 Tax=Orussus abietinus TaxID=222816 RepID=UPI0006267DD1|nr:rhythmically expressed gene 2 protein-like [Orussus abietinus]